MASTLTLEVRPSSRSGYVTSLDGEALAIPDGWALLKPGDAALSRRIKLDGPSWTVKEPKGRKLFSRGIWAPAERIEVLRKQLEAERKDPNYQKKLDAGRARRAAEQERYVEEFKVAVQHFLNFSFTYDAFEDKLADAVTAHAIPVGSGTVARTQRIPIEQRAESAVIAWMRHQTSAYDQMTIPREKGKRREVRRMLAKRSRVILDQYRLDKPFDLASCPLAQALQS
ncbi:DUF2293 domain-containing protein [Rubritalea marina]|uniref:DUF2293 domain-containing protein n=1 Tax=Rubritalea marina TaxID=361055 RepID=UPI0003678CBF|nr:DUF2293 domain-containing protein [Rubritalea marina]